MPTIKLKPTTPSRRQMTLPTFEELTKFSPEKSLVVIKKKNAGRNANGKITNPPQRRRQQAEISYNRFPAV